MQLNKLIKTTTRSKKRVGRGTGSGKGKTSTRGTKGQKARGKVSLGFIGGTLPFYKKIPYRRGVGNTKRSLKMIPLSLSALNVFTDKAEVGLESLIEKKLVSPRKALKQGVKIVGDGEINVAITLKLSATSTAVAKIEKSGGKVVNV